MARRDTFLSDTVALFRALPGVWIDGLIVARVGGAYAWRTRVSEARKIIGGTIENRVRRKGARKISEYRFVPAMPSGAEH
jgi:hypothetical protein